MTNETIHARLIDMESALRDVMEFESQNALSEWQETHPGESPYTEFVYRHETAKHVLAGASYAVARAEAEAEVASRFERMGEAVAEAAAAEPQIGEDTDARRAAMEVPLGERGMLIEEEPDEAALARAENERVLEAFRQQGTPGAEPGA